MKMINDPDSIKNCKLLVELEIISFGELDFLLLPSIISKRPIRFSIKVGDLKEFPGGCLNAQ